jgi:hypothetical protein
MWLVRCTCAFSASSARISGSAASWPSPTWRSPIAAFAEPVLFGRIIDPLTPGQEPGGAPVSFATLMPLILAWIAFGLFSIGAGVLVALNADRLSHRRA